MTYPTFHECSCFAAQLLTCLIMGADAGPNGVLTDRWICTFFCPLKSKNYGLLKQMRVLDTGLGIYSVALVPELLVHSLTHSLIHSFIQQVFTMHVYRFAAEDRGPDPPLTQAHAEPAAGEPLRWAPRGSTCSSLVVGLAPLSYGPVSI